MDLLALGVRRKRVASDLMASIKELDPDYYEELEDDPPPDLVEVDFSKFPNVRSVSVDSVSTCQHKW